MPMMNNMGMMNPVGQMNPMGQMGQFGQMPGMPNMPQAASIKPGHCAVHFERQPGISKLQFTTSTHPHAPTVNGTPQKLANKLKEIKTIGSPNIT